MKTVIPNIKELKRNWYLIDAKDKILGKVATKAADMLRGKHKAIFTPHLDCGDFIVIINAEKIRVTGNKLADKKYYRHSGFPGGLKEVNLETLLKKRPIEAVMRAIRGMIPHNRLKKTVLTKLKVYSGEEHPHAAQNPETLAL